MCATVGSTSIDNLYGTGVVRHPVELRPDCLVELQEGRVAAITSDDSILVGFKRQDPQTKIVGSCINVERYGMAINRAHPEFVRFVNGVLERIGAGGLQRIRDRWLRGPGCADERGDRALQPPPGPAAGEARGRPAASAAARDAVAAGAGARACRRPRSPGCITATRRLPREASP